MPPVVTPNFNETMKPIQPGIYNCRIQAAELKTSQRTGTSYISWELAIEQLGQKIFHNTPIDGRGAGMFKHFVRSAGDEKYESGPYDTGNLLGHIVVCEIEDETYLSQGQERMRSKVREVRKYEPEQGNFNEADLPF